MFIDGTIEWSIKKWNEIKETNCQANWPSFYEIKLNKVCGCFLFTHTYLQPQFDILSRYYRQHWTLYNKLRIAWMHTVLDIEISI